MFDAGCNLKRLRDSVSLISGFLSFAYCFPRVENKTIHILSGRAGASLVSACLLACLPACPLPPSSFLPVLLSSCLSPVLSDEAAHAVTICRFPYSKRTPSYLPTQAVEAREGRRTPGRQNAGQAPDHAPGTIEAANDLFTSRGHP